MHTMTVSRVVNIKTKISSLSLARQGQKNLSIANTQPNPVVWAFHVLTCGVFHDKSSLKRPLTVLSLPLLTALSPLGILAPLVAIPKFRPGLGSGISGTSSSILYPGVTPMGSLRVLAPGLCITGVRAGLLREIAKPSGFGCPLTMFASCVRFRS